MNLIIEQQSSIYCSVLCCINKCEFSTWYTVTQNRLPFSSFGKNFELHIKVDEMLSFGIAIKNCTHPTQSRITFAISGPNGVKQYMKSVNHTFSIENNILFSDSWKILRSDYGTNNDNIMIWCELTNLGSETVQTNQLEKQLSMRKENKFTDITIMVGEKQIQAHKFMLATRSPVFDTMLSSDMLEGRQNQILINDFEYEVIDELIYFIYSDQTPNLHRLAYPLFMAADKYGMDRLKARCEKVLSETITVENVFKVQSVAELYDAKLLKQMVKHFIIGNIAEIQETTDWKQIVTASTVRP